MKALIKILGGLFFCFASVFGDCNAMSVNVETFYKDMREGKVVSVDLCNKVTIDVLEKISAITIEKTNLDAPDRIVSVGADEDCPITAMEELEGELASYMDILQNVDKALKGREGEGDDVVTLQQQLMEVFRIYSECDSDGFRQSCQDMLAKIKL